MGKGYGDANTWEQFRGVLPKDSGPVSAISSAKFENHQIGIDISKEKVNICLRGGEKNLQES